VSILQVFVLAIPHIAGLTPAAYRSDMAKKPFERCWTCGGTLIGRQGIDLRNGLPVIHLVCVSCSRRWEEGDTPRLAIAA